MDKISILILDFCRPNEGLLLLESLQKYAPFNKEIVYLCNGGESEYAHEFYKQGLIDTLIIKKNGDGGGFGQTDLFRYCKTKYAIFCQVDQFLLFPLKQCDIDYFISLLKDGYKCIDLNGDQSNRGTWTDRAHLIDVDFFNSLSPFPNGAPGNTHHLKWNEQYLQEIFTKNDYKIAHISPSYFKDNGCYSVRENPDKSIWIHRCDTKQAKLIRGPIKEKYIYPKFSDSEWKYVLETQSWPQWKIPEQEIPHSFVCFKEKEIEK